MLISEHKDGLDLSLYISADVIKHIEDTHPEKLIEQGKYSEFCLMLEGVSHFVYVVWNANYDKQVTLFEMELQAEIDKFVLLQSVFDKINDQDALVILQNWLFEKSGFDQTLSDTKLQRYAQANYYAGKYCMSLQQQFKLRELNSSLLNELRRFYRLGQQDKLRYINRLH